MRVICVEKLNNYGGVKSYYASPEVGEKCEVIKTVPGCNCSPFYVLAEYPGFSYHSRAFATLPDQTADEMKEETKEAIVNLETV